MERNIVITRQDENDEPISASLGEAFIGRALISNCKDRRIRDNHGLLRVSSDGKFVVLTPLKRMYFIPRRQVKRQVLERGSAVTLQSGDRFSFLPQRFCFRINISGTPGDKPSKRKCSSSLIDQHIVTGQCSNDDTTPEAAKKMKRSSDEELADKKNRKASHGDNDEEEEESNGQQKNRETAYRSDSTTNIQDLEPLEEVSIPKAGRRKVKSNSSSEEDDFGHEDGDYDERQSGREKGGNTCHTFCFHRFK